MRHYIFVQWKPEETAQENLARHAEQLFSKAAAAPGVQGVTVSRACIRGHNRCDLMICMELSRDALTAFDASPLHQEWKAQFGPHIAQKWIFDCE